VTSQFPVFFSRRSNAFSAGNFSDCFLGSNWLPFYILDHGYLASFHSLCLCSNTLSNPGRSWLFMSESVTLLVDSLYAEAIEAIKSRRFIYFFLRVNFDSR
jgi:hypothetical protein